MVVYRLLAINLLAGLLSWSPFVHAVAPIISRDTNSSQGIYVSTTPDTQRTYIVPYLEGTALQLGDDVFRFPVTKNSSGGELVFVNTNGQSNMAVNPHYHAKAYETFYCVKGRVNLWASDEQRILSPGDFGAVPHNVTHSYQFIEPDTFMIGVIQPGGFEDFFFNVSTPYNPSFAAPFPPDQPLAFPAQQFFAVAPLFDVQIISDPHLNYDIVNGTTNNATWHTGNNTLASDHTTPYYVANNWGPKYLVNTTDADDGKVIAPLVTSTQSDGNWTLGTVAMKKSDSSKLPSFTSYEKGQVIFVIEGRVQVELSGGKYPGTYTLNHHDTIYIAPGQNFRYWNPANWAKVYIASAGTSGILPDLLNKASSWGYATFPAY